MNFTCPICGKVINQELVTIIAHGEDHIVDEIKKKHPNWAQGNGLCKKCYQYYKNQLHPNNITKSKLFLLKENVLARFKQNKERTKETR